MKTFKSFRLDTVNHCLWNQDERASLTPKAFDVLRYLVEHSDRLVSQDELLEALWPETYVNPEGIRKYILEIRKVLGDRPGEPAFIETTPKRGYQFVAAVTEDSRTTRVAPSVQCFGNMVGREAGLKELDESLDRALAGQRQVVFVTGEPGIGKTMLVDAFQQAAVGRPDLRVARGQCIEGFGGKEAYYPMLEALGSLLNDPGAAPWVETLAKRAPTWLIQFPALLNSEQRASVHREILGSSRERMVREICEALEAITSQTPLVVVLEDLHWVDPSTVDLISAVARRREAARLLVIGTYRPVDVVLSQSPLKALKRDLLARGLVQEVAIERLGETDVAEYLEKAFSVRRVAAGIASLIHRNSGGNPLFMAAIVQEMAGKGLIVGQGDELTLTAPLEEINPGIPETLQQMLETQLDQLDAEELSILQSGSVAGERFSVWSVAAMLGSPPGAIEETCERLAKRQQFIHSCGTHAGPNGTASAHYEFRHALYRRSLYRSLAAVTRSKLHAAFAERLWPICELERPGLAAEVALHFEEGRDYERAARFLILAADNAVRRFSYRDSIQMLRQAAELVSTLPPPVRAELEIQLAQNIGAAHHALGEMSDSAASYAKAAELSANAGIKKQQICSLVHLAIPLLYTHPARGYEVCRQAIELSRDFADPVVAARTQLSAASLRLLNDDWRKEDAELCDRAQKIIVASNANIPPDVHYAYVLSLQGNFQEAHRQADILIDTSTNPTSHVLAFGARGMVFLARGQFGAFFDLISKGRQSADRDGDDAWMYIFGEAWLRMLCGDFDGVRRLSQITMQSDGESHAAWTRTAYRMSSGYRHLHAGELAEGLEQFREVIDCRITPPFFLHWHWRIHARFGLIEALLAARDLERADSAANVLLQSDVFGVEPNITARTWEIKSRIARAREDWLGAREYTENALALLERYEIPTSAWHVHRTAGDLCAAQCEPERAARHRERAKEEILKIADSFETGEPLRESFLAAAPVRRLFEQVTSA